MSTEKADQKPANVTEAGVVELDDKELDVISGGQRKAGGGQPGIAGPAQAGDDKGIIAILIG